MATHGLEAPVALAANPIPRRYRGGDRIAAFRRGGGAPGPEDWVGSTERPGATSGRGSRG